MGYIGRQPTGSILTSADIADGSISTAKLADTAVSTAKIADDAISTAKIADSAVTAAKATGINPVLQAVSYRLAGDLSGNQDPVANWEPIDDAMAGRIGTGITESGGHFSFTETGIYQVQFTGVAYDSGSDDVQINAEIFASSDSGGSYDKLAQGMTNLHHAAQHTFSISTIVDITNTSTNRVKFRIDGNNGVINGNSNETFTFASFVRLGNT